MLFSVDIASKAAHAVRRSSLAELGLRERYDLQEWVLHTPGILGEDLLVITSEFSGFDRTAERLDILAIDRFGVLAVVELKRTAVGTAAELQALRYAAYCSTLSLGDVAEMLSAYATKQSGAAVTPSEAEARIRTFVGDPEFAALGDRPRVILAAEDFPPEITATVLWLRSYNVDVSCVRLRPYTVDGQLLLDAAVLIPLPEAREFQIRREVKAAEPPRLLAREVTTADEFVGGASDEVRPLLTSIRGWLLGQTDIREEVFKTVLGYRRGQNRDWVTWLKHTRYEARVALPPDVEIDPALYVRRSSSGWSIVRARTPEEVEQVLALLRATSLGER